jgi:hypothetical protein
MSKYNKEFLKQYCEDNSIELIINYSEVKINRELKLDGKCLTKDCQNTFHKSFRYMIELGALCSVCSIKKGIEKSKIIFLEKYGGNPLKNKEIREKAKKTNIERYGVENPFQNKEIKEKIKKTNIERYGVEHALQSVEIKEKMKKTNIKKYGSENSFQVEEFKEKGRNTCIEKYGVDNAMKLNETVNKVKYTNLERYGVEHARQSVEINDKMKKHNVEKYGVEHVLQVKEFKEKGRQTQLKLYGVDNPMKRNDVKEKAKKTNLANCGFEYASQSDHFRELYKKTCMERYGVEHPMQNKEIMSKNTASQYKVKTHTLPSGKEIQYQGYEIYAINDLLKIYKEEDIINEPDKVPEIWYEIDNKKHRHYVDIFIPIEKLCIEVKSLWTIQKKKDYILAKQSSAKEMGFRYEIWVYDKEGNKIDTI